MTKQANQLKLQQCNILIVDDTPVNLEVVINFLESYGFGTRVARSGESALKRVQYDPPDIILLDVLMPGMDGFETCRRLKMQDSTKDIPVIFMTSLTGIEDKVKGFEVGAVDYVTKPLYQEEVFARISTHLRLRDLALRLEEKNKQLEQSNRVERLRLFEAVSRQGERLRALTNKLTQVQEVERAQLARELHDEMGQALTAISINLTSAVEELPPEIGPGVKDRLAEASWLADQTLDQIRELSLNLRPPMLDDLGLVPTLLWYIKRYTKRVNIDVDLETIGLERRLPPIIETALYRVVQEALTNITKHAQTANNVHIRLERSSSTILVCIKDNGRGFDTVNIMEHDAEGNGTGILGMRERIMLLGGNFEVESQPGLGTSLLIEIPWENGPVSESDQLPE